MTFWQFCILTLVVGFVITMGILYFTDIGKENDRETKD
jgi:uncharacterized membrane-anchored protein YhcB (DUF1043 family)